MLSIVSSFKNNFPGISEKAIEELFRAAVCLHSNKRVHTCGGSSAEPVKISRAYLAGMVKAFRMCGQMPEFREEPTYNGHGMCCNVHGDVVGHEKVYVEVHEQVELIENIVESWIRDEM